jgi:hypothetical protein
LILFCCKWDPQHFLNFLPLPQGQGSLRPTFGAAGHFGSVEEVIGEALKVLHTKEQSSAGVTANGAQREAVREMLAFVEKNRVHLEGVSVKELIHDGRRP